MSLQFSVQILPQQVREATRGIFWRQVTQVRALLILAGLLLLMQALLWALIPQAGWILHVLLLILLLSSALALAFFAARYYEGLALRNFTRFQGAPVAVSLDEEAYRYQAAWGQGGIPWGDFDSLWRFNGVWVLLQHRQGGVSVLLPSDGLDEEARAFIVRKVGQGKA